MINFQEKWLRARDAASFPYSGHFMRGKDPKHLREMWSFDLLNERLQPIWSSDVHHDCLQWILLDNDWEQRSSVLLWYDELR